jgi:hypothetical protein
MPKRYNSGRRKTGQKLKGRTRYDGKERKKREKKKGTPSAEQQSTFRIYH